MLRYLLEYLLEYLLFQCILAEDYMYHAAILSETSFFLGPIVVYENEWLSQLRRWS